MILPAGLHAAVANLIDASGDPSAIQRITPVSGGDINQAARIETLDRSYFLKYQSHPPAGMFEAEQRGLGLLAESAGMLQVPATFGCGNLTDPSGSFLLLEWIEPGRKSDRCAEALGQGLAELHRSQHPDYGLDHDNFIGRLAQPNGLSTSWGTFYAEKRLAVQRDLAARLHHLPAHRGARLNSLIARLPEWIDEASVKPSLLHGDFWGGNWMASAAGESVLIDPAVYYGDREIDLAMASLFGGFPDSFFQAYREAYPLAAGWEDRRSLYQLYYLLVHLNLFGETYGAPVDAILARYD